MFFHSDNSNKKQEPMSDHQFYSILCIIGAGLGCLWLAKNENYLKWLFFKNFGHIGVGICLLLMAVAFLLRWKARDLFHQEIARIKLLSKVWSSWRGIGVGEADDGAFIFLPEKARTGHVQIIGATGRGKTESVILPWFMRDLERGHSAVLLDGKGDRELAERIASYWKIMPTPGKLVVFDLGHEAYVNGFDARGRRVQRKRKGIDTLRKAEQMAFELKRELALLKEKKVEPYFEEWLEECREMMKVMYRPSTFYTYEKTIGRWIEGTWTGRAISQITRADVHELVFETIKDEEATMHTRKWVLKMVKRIFQMAVDHGRLSQNPCNGMMVKVPESDKKVLTNSEVETFLREAS